MGCRRQTGFRADVEVAVAGPGYVSIVAGPADILAVGWRSAQKDLVPGGAAVAGEQQVAPVARGADAEEICGAHSDPVADGANEPGGGPPTDTGRADGGPGGAAAHEDLLAVGSGAVVAIGEKDLAREVGLGGGGDQWRYEIVTGAPVGAAGAAEPAGEGAELALIRDGIGGGAPNGVVGIGTHGDSVVGLTPAHTEPIPAPDLVEGGGCTHPDAGAVVLDACENTAGRGWVGDEGIVQVIHEAGVLAVIPAGAAIGAGEETSIRAEVEPGGATQVAEGGAVAVRVHVGQGAGATAGAG